MALVMSGYALINMHHEISLKIQNVLSRGAINIVVYKTEFVIYLLNKV